MNGLLEDGSLWNKQMTWGVCDFEWPQKAQWSHLRDSQDGGTKTTLAILTWKLSVLG